MIKKYVFLGIVFLVLLFTPTQDGKVLALNEADPICGDIDGSTVINMLDITFLISYLYNGGPAPDVLEMADMDSSGDVNLLDIMWLIAYLYKGGPAPCFESALPSHKYLFDVWFCHYGWSGFTLYGFYLDNERNVYTYENYDVYLPNWPYMTDNEINQKNSFDVLVDSVDYSSLLWAYNLIEAASEGPLSDRVNVCFDVGGTGWYALEYDSTTSLYHAVLLYEAGDWAQKNLAPEAETLFDWLNAVNSTFANPLCSYPGD